MDIKSNIYKKNVKKSYIVPNSGSGNSSQVHKGYCLVRKVILLGAMLFLLNFRVFAQVDCPINSISNQHKFNNITKEEGLSLYSVSHNRRAPLRSIDGFSHVLLDEFQNKIDEQGQEYLHCVRSAGQRIGHLIDDMLFLSRVSRGELNIRRMNLSKILHKISLKFKGSDSGRKVNFTVQDEIWASADELLFRVVLTNLLGNALKLISRQAKATIEFKILQQDNKQVFFVCDNGAGFNMKYAQKLFGAFQRLHVSKEFQGTGIGLATVQHIVHSQGG